MHQREKKYFPILLALIFLLSSAKLFGQWGFQMSLNQEYNNNPFHLPQQEKSWVSSALLGAERSWKHWDLSYEGLYSDFANMRDRNFYWHSLTLQAGSDTTMFSLSAEQRIDKTGYDLYDYWNTNAQVTHRFFVKNFTINLSGRAEMNFFNQVQELNNMKFSAGIGFNRSFQTKTILIARADFEYKNYQNSQTRGLSDAPLMMDMPVAIAGWGRENSNANGNHGSKRGYMDNDHGRGFMTPHAYSDFVNASVSQIVSMVRVAQSVAPTLGVALQYVNRGLVGGNSRFITGVADSYSKESEIFNDPMGYESDVIGAEITKIFPWAIRLKLSAYFSKKNFTAQGIYSDSETYDENVLRVDDTKVAYSTISKDLNFSAFAVTIAVNYQWLENRSNSYWYDYRNQYAAIGLEFYF
ncbi:MAG: hypothetical protein GXO74_02520 [Calditrichaeota bacterium]|nr:hypothetical protein [Calditrichota bacterium]